jgi:hypothetical protein
LNSAGRREFRPVDEALDHVVGVGDGALGDVGRAVRHADEPDLLARSILPCWALPYCAMSETWPMKPDVQAWPPVFE